MNRYPGLAEELSRLGVKLQHEVRWPAARSQSALLRVLPESTFAYVALPNYGEAVGRALEVFRQERETSAAVREWWQHSVMDGRPNFETLLAQCVKISQYLGDEIVLSAGGKNNDYGILAIAKIQKPGLEPLLRRSLRELAGKSTPPRILLPGQLATAREQGSAHEPVFLLRPGLLVLGSDLKTVKAFSAQLDRGLPGLAGTAFGRRIAESYRRSTGVLVALDLQKILALTPVKGIKTLPVFQSSGFAEVKYAVLEYKDVTGQAASQSELSFTGPRHGIASWLGAPVSFGSLDFVSPQAGMALAIHLKSLPEMFADVKQLASLSNPQATNQLAALEPMLAPLLVQFTGELAVEMQTANAESPEWKVVLGVRGADALQGILALSLTAFQPRKTVQDGLTYYELQIPSGTKPVGISYVFSDGYFLLGSSRQLLAAAVELHKSGESLGRSSRFQAQLPPGRSRGASLVLYENSVAFLASMATQMPPELRQAWSQAPGLEGAVVDVLYGDPDAIRQASRGGASGVTPAAVIAAIAIPNVLRARIAANEASAVGSLRSVNTAQAAYAAQYPARGYARDLVSLAGDPRSQPSPEHARLLDPSLGCTEGTAGGWCTKTGYKFSLQSICGQQNCRSYVAVATPVSNNTGQRSFCTAGDGVIRFNLVRPSGPAIDATACASWEPVK
jgi:type II secretory pathway pseudopilin PulG